MIYESQVKYHLKFGAEARDPAGFIACAGSPYESRFLIRKNLVTLISYIDITWLLRICFTTTGLTLVTVIRIAAYFRASFF